MTHRLHLATGLACALSLVACSSLVATTGSPFDPVPGLGAVVRSTEAVALVPTPKGCKIQAGLFGSSADKKGAAASWEGACGTDGLATGPGTLKWVAYDAAGNRKTATWSRGPMERGWITDQRASYVMEIPEKYEKGRPLRVSPAEAGVAPAPAEAMAFFRSLMPGAVYTATGEQFTAIDTEWQAGKSSGSLFGAAAGLGAAATAGSSASPQMPSLTTGDLSTTKLPSTADLKPQMPSASPAASGSQPAAAELPQAQALDVPGFESGRADACIKFKLEPFGKGLARNLLSVNTCAHPVVVIGRACVESYVSKSAYGMSVGTLAMSHVSGPTASSKGTPGLYTLGPNAERAAGGRVFAPNLFGGPGAGEPQIKQIVFAAFGPPYVRAAGKGYAPAASFEPVTRQLAKMEQQLEGMKLGLSRKNQWGTDSRPTSCATVDLQEVWRTSR